MADASSAARAPGGNSRGARSPWPYPITAQVTLEPVEHRFVAAPFEGVFEQSLVLPGDQVEPGQVLGRMDGRELRTKLSALEAELARVTRSRDANSSHETNSPPRRSIA